MLLRVGHAELRVEIVKGGPRRAPSCSPTRTPGRPILKGNQAMTSDLTPNADPANIDTLRAKHPAPTHPDRDPTKLSSIVWPNPDELRSHWRSQEGTDHIRKWVGTDKIAHGLGLTKLPNGLALTKLPVTCVPGPLSVQQTSMVGSRVRS